MLRPFWRSTRRSWLPASLLWGTVLLATSFAWLCYGFTLDDEKLLVQTTAIARMALTAEPATHYADEFLFVDTAYDPALIEATDADGFPLGRQIITDRAALAAFFRALRAADVHRFVLCDIAFVAPSPDDAALQAALDGLRDVVVPQPLDAHGTPVPLVVDAPRALARYRKDGGTFVRFPLVQADTMVTVPIAMHRAMHPGAQILGSLSLPTFVPALRLLPQAMPAPIPLGQLLPVLADSAQARTFLDERIVVVGDLSSPRDQHDTVVGSIPGALLLANVYLALREGDHVASPPLLAFLWLALVGLTWATLRRELGPAPRASRHQTVDRDAGTQGAAPTIRERARELAADGVENTVWLVLISLTTCAAFGLHVPVLILALALTAFVETLRWRHALLPLLRAAGQRLHTARTRLVRQRIGSSPRLETQSSAPAAERASSEPASPKAPGSAQSAPPRADGSDATPRPARTHSAKAHPCKAHPSKPHPSKPHPANDDA